MAKLQKSAVVLRFRIGRGLVKGRQRYENTARAILESTAFSYAKNEYDKMRKTLEQHVEEDVRAELVHLAYLFRRHIIGAAGTRSTPSGSLDTVAKGEGQPRMILAAGLPPWPARNSEYLRQKRNATGGITWFDNRGWRGGGKRQAVPPHSGLLFEEMRADTWETIFGPINVRFYKNRKLDASAENPIATGTGKRLQIQIGTISVRALGRIEPSMLPGFTSGEVHASASGNSGLISLVGKYDPKLAYRLGMMNNGIYRPTLEPFLGFFLTRALPHAVNQRIKKGTLGTLFRTA